MDFFNLSGFDMGSGFTITPLGPEMNTVRYSSGWQEPQETRKPAPKIARIISQDYSEIKSKCLEQSALWEDPNFKAANSSVYHSRNIGQQFEWKRPGELCDDPHMFIGGATRFDIKQGDLGNCWFLAALGSLCAAGDERLLHRVIPKDNSFTRDYAGVFHFQIWQYGKWIDVVIDDRLPTLNGRLQFVHSPSKNEFWPALLEKAYAKLNGSYEALSGGNTSEGMEDFTGGIIEQYDFREKYPDDLFRIMNKCHKRHSLMGTSIETGGMALESTLPSGLVVGHAYSVTSVKKVHIRGRDIFLVRLRNPWGSKEWNGPWSDGSNEWRSLSDQEKQEFGLTFDDDGEFWMAYQDFIGNYHKLEICLLTPGTLSEKRGMRWEVTSEQGSWRRRVNAGGCRNSLDTFWTNPQYRVRVSDRDDDDNEFGTLIVALMQKERRKKRKEGLDLLTIGYAIYKVPEGDVKPLDLNYFKYNASTAKSPTFCNMREVSGRHRLPPGTYVIIPSTFKPGEEGDFLLRVFSENKIQSGEVDEPTGLIGVDPQAVEEVPPSVIGADAENRRRRSLKVTDADAQKEKEVKQIFKQTSGSDKELDAYELRNLLNDHFKAELAFGGFSLDSCRSMVAMMDADRSGKLGYDEFKPLWGDLRRWKKVFVDFDRDRSGGLNSHELRQALNSAGFSVSNATFKALVMRYSDQKGAIDFDDFISCALKLKTMFAIFKQSSQGNVATFDIDKFIQTAMYA